MIDSFIVKFGSSMFGRRRSNADRVSKPFHRHSPSKILLKYLQAVVPYPHKPVVTNGSQRGSWLLKRAQSAGERAYQLWTPINISALLSPLVSDEGGGV